jgi:hypothetical protein
MAASWAASRRVWPASTYRLSDRISRAMNTTSRSEAAASSTIPSRANSSSGYTSGGSSSGSPSRASPWATIRVASTPTASRIARA